MRKKLISVFILLTILLLTGCVTGTKTRVTFITNIDSGIGDRLYNSNELLKEESLPNKDIKGYEFKGWFTEKNYETPYWEIVLTKPLTLYGYYEELEIIEYTITLLSDVVIYDSLTREEGDVLRSDQLQGIEVEDYLFLGWFTDSAYLNAFNDQVIEGDLTLYARYDLLATRPEMLALYSIEMVNETDQDIILPTEVNGYQVTWTSFYPEIIDHDGKYHFVESDVVVVLEAKISTAIYVYTLAFEITILPTFNESVFDDIFASLSFTKYIYNDLILPYDFNYGVNARWLSNNEQSISTSGQVNRTSSDVNVVLTLELSKYGITKTKDYEVIVVRQASSESDVVFYIDSLINQGKNVYEAIMNYDEILSYNQIVKNSALTNVVDLVSRPQTLTKAEVNTLISKYNNMNSRTVYNNGVVVTTAQKEAVLNNRNLNNIPVTVNVQYAVSVQHTNLRSYPTDYYSNSSSIDYFQETGFSAGIPMIVYHQSLDQQWYYVRMYNYDGWVKASDIGICDRTTFLNYANPAKFIVILDSMLTIEGQGIRMGYKLPYSQKNENNYLVNFPTRAVDGTLSIKLVNVQNNTKVNDGFLIYNYENMLRLAFALLGTPYSWGDKNPNGFDCSSTQAAIFSCFGFVLGRNTSNQRTTDQYGKTTSITNQSLKNYQVGTLLYTSGHVLMYVGVDASGNCILMHNTTSGNICKIQTLNSFGTSGIQWLLLLHN